MQLLLPGLRLCRIELSLLGLLRPVTGVRERRQGERPGAVELWKCCSVRDALPSNDVHGSKRRRKRQRRHSIIYRIDRRGPYLPRGEMRVRLSGSASREGMQSRASPESHAIDSVIKRLVCLRETFDVMCRSPAKVEGVLLKFITRHTDA